MYFVVQKEFLGYPTSLTHYKMQVDINFGGWDAGRFHSFSWTRMDRIKDVTCCTCPFCP
jgi:hypothetical protein